MIRTISTNVLVSSGQKNLLEEQMKICSMLWDAGIPVRNTVIRVVTITVVYRWKCYIKISVQKNYFLQLALT